MSVRYHLVGAHELDEGAIAAWRAAQSATEVFAGPYFCPEFTRAVAEVRKDVRVVAIENDGRLVGFFPHQRSLLGFGRPVGGPLSDYHGVIALPEAEWEIEPIMRAARLSVWAFDHLVGDRGRFGPYVSGSAISPQINLQQGYEQYAATRRAAGSEYLPKTQALARKARKCAREHGPIEFTLHDADPAAIEALFRWKGEQYRRSGIVNGFAYSWTRELLRRICAQQDESFAGLCSTLRVGGQLAAVHVGMRSRTVLHYWFPAYDTKFAKFSLGILLLFRMAQAVSPCGIRVIDLGKGDEPYKEWLMNGSAKLLEGCVELPSLLGLARNVRRRVEARAHGGGLGRVLRLPVRALRRLERQCRFR